MKKIMTVMISFVLVSILVCACAPTVQTVVVTLVVLQTQEVTRLATQIIQVEITTTPIPTNAPFPTATISSTPMLAPLPTDTPWVAITLTPGLQAADNNTRPNVEKIVSAQDIKNYLVLSYGMRAYYGKVFCAYQPLGIGYDGKTTKFYLWIMCKEYYIDSHGTIKSGAGISMPVVLLVEIHWVQYRIVGALETERDYLTQIQENFPLAIQKLIMPSEYPSTYIVRADVLTTELDQDAKSYFMH